MQSPSVDTQDNRSNPPVYRDHETRRLELVYAVQAASAATADQTAYRFSEFGAEYTFIRFRQGPVDEAIAFVDFADEVVLLLESTAGAHTVLVDHLEAVDWTVHLVDGLVAPTCPDCYGAGAFHLEDTGDVDVCETCDGKGRL